MLTKIRKIGNSQGVLIPKPLLRHIGLTDKVEILIRGDTLVIQKPKRRPREGWDEAGKALAASGDDAPVWPEFGNEGDADWEW